MEKKLCVMLVDDNDDFLEVLSMDLEDFGYRTILAEGAETALRSLQEHKVDVIISDLHMEGMSGLELIAELKESKRIYPVIVLSGEITKESASEAMKYGAYEILEKPVEPEDLKQVLKGASALAQKYREAREKGLSEVDHGAQMTSTAAAFDTLVAGQIEGGSPSEQGSGLQGMLAQSNRAIALLTKKELFKTSLNFLARSYNLIRESAEAQGDEVLAGAADSACQCFTYFRVNPRALLGKHVKLFSDYNKYLADLIQNGPEAMSRHMDAVNDVTALAREMDDAA